MSIAEVAELTELAALLFLLLRLLMPLRLRRTRGNDVLYNDTSLKLTRGSW